MAATEQSGRRKGQRTNRASEGKKNVVVLAEKRDQARQIAEAMGWRMSGDFGTGTFNGQKAVIVWASGHLVEIQEPQEIKPDASWSNPATLLPIPRSFDMRVSKPNNGRKGKSPSQYLKVIREQLRQAGEVIISTDPDREGTAIAWQLLEHCRFKGSVKHAWLVDGLDKSAVQKTFHRLKTGDEMKSWFRASEARSRSDWAYQFAVRALTCYARHGKMGNLLGQGSGRESVVSVGRVQTPTLTMVVERCREIRNFVPKDHFLIEGQFDLAGQQVAALYKPVVTAEIIDAAPAGVEWEPSKRIVKDGESEPLDTPLFTGQQEVQSFRERLLAAGDKAIVVGSKTRELKRQPPLPCDLAEFQAEMHKASGLTASKAQKVLEKLYNDGLVTYPRTEHAELPLSLYEPGERNPVLDHLTNHAQFSMAASRARDIHNGQDTGYPSFKPSCFTKKPMEHYGIIPTRKAAHLDRMNSLERQAYEIVAHRYIQALWPPALIREQKLGFAVPCEDLLGHPHSRFATTLNMVLDPGWQQAFPSEREKETDIQPVPVTRHMPAPLKNVELKTRTTRPPAWFTDRTLIKAMKSVGRFVRDPQLRKILRDSAGIGTPATRSTILETLLAREFIARKGNRLESTPKGEALIDDLPSWFVQVETTAVWEDWLNRICELRRDDETACQQRDKFVFRQLDRLEGYLQELQQRHGAISGSAPRRSGASSSGPRKPTPKMLAFANVIARTLGQPLPRDVTQNGRACSQYIDKNKSCLEPS
ncbi:DNA topoisomerase [Sansalvadorimonas sp. 2012CJ34-2]|uniref:DNA topoisomerase n=1 Tax=Parendozoicomonas callyspongiae TaxID=2942213 RepID=A0ABT0PG00_9GAMM|nr:DNA topoisomerase [Sansalvadorimonas sp. 2012CJ34-2]MCL6269692.1 DNA topoisomerase [Sansalvadorimonas sp. 2012CJ34-2]